jgi:Fe-S cluster assembly scaffold protein SufB
MAAVAPKFEAWLPESAVRALSEELGDPEWMAARRKVAFERFLELPLEPNPLYRGYGYFANVDLTGVDPVGKGRAVAEPPADPGAITIVHDASGTRVSLPKEVAAEGVTVRTLSELWKEDGQTASHDAAEEPPDRLSALATALTNRAYRLEIPDGMATPLRVREYSILSRPREVLDVQRTIRTGRGSQLFLTEESYSAGGDSDGQRLLGSSTALSVGAGAKAVVLSVHGPDAKTVALYRRTATTGDGARLAWIWNGLGGFRTKVRNRTHLAGNGSVVDDLQTFFGTGEQSYDSSVDLQHTATDTHGQSITRGVFRDSARGMSRGLVRIEVGARKTISYISEHAMLLSKGARSDTIPILEILCRDVKATHSTSVAPVDPERVFYLRSRGIEEADAVRMIGEGFLSYVLDRSPIAALRDGIYPLLAARWDGLDVRWGAEGAPRLPPLHVTGTETAPEWRFDAKLR